MGVCYADLKNEESESRIFESEPDIEITEDAVTAHEQQMMFGNEGWT